MNASTRSARSPSPSAPSSPLRSPHPPSRRRSAPARRCATQRAKRMKELGKAKEAKTRSRKQPQQLYPNATRQSPEAKAKGKNLKALQELQEAYEKQDYAGVIAKADADRRAADANAYEKSFAYQLAGASASEMGDEAKAAEYFKKAVDANGLDNNSHYQAMYNLAVVQYGQGKNDEALAHARQVPRRDQVRTSPSTSVARRLLANTGRSDEAAKIFEDQLAKNPNDKKALLNAVVDLPGRRRRREGERAARGCATSAACSPKPKELRALYVGYINAERYKDAQKVIEDGVAKGIIKDGPDLAKDYMMLGQNAYYNGSDSDAIAFYRQGRADGEGRRGLPQPGQDPARPGQDGRSQGRCPEGARQGRQEAERSQGNPRRTERPSHPAGAALVYARGIGICLEIPAAASPWRPALQSGAQKASGPTPEPRA